MRGSTVFDGAADASIFVSREEGAMEGQIFARKIKSAADGWTWDFAINKYPLISGHASLVVEKIIEEPLADAIKPEADEFGGKQETNKIFVGGKHWDRQLCFNILNALQDDFEAGRGWCDAKNTPRNFRSNMKSLFKIDANDAEVMINFWYTHGMLNVDENKKTKAHGYKLGSSWLPDFKRQKYER